MPELPRYRFSRLFVLIALFVFATSVYSGSTERISVDSSGVEANNDSRYICAVSSDGTIVAFASRASNLVSGDTNGWYDIFLRNRTTGTTERVSITDTEGQANGSSYWPSMSKNGNLVAFFSYATNLVVGDTNNRRDVFLRDVSGGTTTLISRADGVSGALSNGLIDSLAINSMAGDGAHDTVVAFSSNASNLVAGDGNGTWDIFIRNGTTTTRVSEPAGGGDANGPSFAPTLSGDGRYIAFESYASNLVPGDTNGRSDIFVKDTSDGSIVRVSLKDDDTQALLGDNTTCSISEDGTYVAFISTAADMVAGDTNGKPDIFLRNLSTGTTVKISNGLAGAPANGMSYEPAVSSDGSYVTFMSDADNLVAGDTNGAFDMFRWSSSGIIRISLANDDSQANGRSYARGISVTGQYVTFLSYASNLVANDNNSTGDIFLRDVGGTAGTGGTGGGTPATVATGATVRVSVSDNETEGGGDEMTVGGVSADGRYVVFASDSSNLVVGDTNGATDIFVRDRATGATTCLTAGGNGASFNPVISGDGSVIAFASRADNLVVGDTNGVPDIFTCTYPGLTITRITDGNAPSLDPALSPNGRFVAYSSLASNLVAADTSGTWNVFLYDLDNVMSPQTVCCSLTSGSVGGNNASLKPSVSNAGDVAFESQASDLVGSDTNGRGDIFVRTFAGAMERVSVTSVGGQDFGGSFHLPVISGDGNIVAFEAWGWELFGDDFNASVDIVIHNRSTKAVSRIKNGATESNGWCFYPKINSDGQYVSFMCDADNMLAGDTNQAFDVLLYNGSSLERVSVGYDGAQANDRSYNSAMSQDANFIVFHSHAATLVPGDANGKGDIFLRDRAGTSTVPEIRVMGAGQEIVDGATPPTVANDTDMGETVLGASDTVTFTVQNTGTGYLLLNGSPIVDVSGLNAAEFVVTSSPANHVMGHGSTTFTITFTPTALGVRTATLTIANSDSDESVYNYDIQGKCVTREIALSGGGLNIANNDTTPQVLDGTDLGSVVVTNGTAATSTFTITNNGTGDLSLTGTPAVAVSGANAADFLISSAPATTVAASGGTTTFTVRFMPTATGLRQATLTIASDDPNDNPFKFAIQGTGVTPQIALSGGAGGVNIANNDLTTDPNDGTQLAVVTLGSGTTNTSTFTITNSGSAPLNLTGASKVAIGGANAADFSIKTAPAGTVAAGGGTTTFVVEFSPGAAGLRTATLTIENDDLDDDPFVFAIDGLGNTKPVAAAKVLTSNIRAWDTVQLSAGDSTDADPSTTFTYLWTYLSGPMTPGPTITNANQEIASFVPEKAGVYTFRVTISDGYASDYADVGVSVTTRQRLVCGTFLAGTDKWTTVTLPHNYVSLVVVCTPEYLYDPSRPILTPRVRNASGSSFEARLFAGGPLSGVVTGVLVRYIAVEKGAYNVTQHGIKMEATTFVSTQVSRKNGWIADTLWSTTSSFTSPVVVGQIMTTADTDYQVFWARGASQVDAPSTSSIYLGRHIGESPVYTRANETVGAIVFEAGQPSSDGVNLAAGLTADAVLGVPSGPYEQSVTAFAPAGVVLSNAGEDGGDGGYAVLDGNSAITSNSFFVAMDEDTLTDTDRAHTTETVAYVAFDKTNNTLPIAVDQSARTGQGVDVAITLTGLNLSGSETWTVLTNPSNGALSGTAPNLTYSPAGTFVGEDSFTFKVADGGVDSNIATVTIRVAPANPNIISSITMANNSTWTTVSLPKSFTNMVVVCTPSYDKSTTPPVVARVRNAVGNSFEVLLTQIGGTATSISVPVHYLVVEAGTYTQAVHGITMEAVLYTSKEISSKSNWNGVVKRNYLQSYTNPIVIGQVMTYKDSRFQVFWARNNSVGSPPDSANLYVGRHIGEDTDDKRKHEDIGYIVIEAGSGITYGIHYEAGVTADAVTHNTFTEQIFSFSPDVAVLSSAGMDGNNGGFPIVVDTPLLPGGFKLAIDEDQYGDTERNHTTEQVAFATFEATWNVPPPAVPAIAAAAPAPASGLVPFAFNQTVKTVQDQAVEITLGAIVADESDTWTIVTGPSTGTLSAAAKVVTYTPASHATGEVTFQFKVNNGFGDSNTATVTVIVNPPGIVQEPPVIASTWADPDPDAVQSPVNVEATGWDPNDDVVTYNWEKVAGPGTVTFGTVAASPDALTLNADFVRAAYAPGASGAVCEATFSKLGDYQLRVTATDSTGLSTTKDLYVTVDSFAPTGGGGGGGGGCSSSPGGNIPLPLILIVGLLLVLRIRVVRDRKTA